MFISFNYFLISVLVVGAADRADVEAAKVATAWVSRLVVDVVAGSWV